MNILVVDDNLDAAESLAELLEPGGHRVTLAADGSEALEAYHDQPYQLVFMDLKMPHMDGIEASRRILHTDPGARIIMLTGNTVEEDLREVGTVGIVRLLRKPCDATELLRIVDLEAQRASTG